jgi:hypothetical protein
MGDTSDAVPGYQVWVTHWQKFTSLVRLYGSLLEDAHNIKENWVEDRRQCRVGRLSNNSPL